MPGENAFEVEGEVVESCANGTYIVRLANGHELRAYVAGRARKRFSGAVPGQKLTLRLSPYDLSVGRILVATPAS